MTTRPAVWAKRALQSWLAKLPKPAGVFCGTDWDATFVYDGCEQLGLQVGGEVAVVGVGNEDFFCETFNPPLSSIDTQPARIGYEAAALLLGLLRGRRAPLAPRLIAPLGVAARRSSSVCAVEDAHVATVVKYLRDHVEQPIR